MNIDQSYHIAFHTERPIKTGKVKALYDLADWWPNRSLETIAHVLEQHPAIGVWDDDQLIGFARVISDGVTHAYIEDVMVHPDYRRRGVASDMLTRLLESLTHIEVISLFCLPDLISVYEGVGFKVHRKQVMMHLSRN